MLVDENEVRAVVFEYIEPFYNRYRKHSSLDYHSPVEFEQLNFPSRPAGREGKKVGQADFTQN